MKRFDAGSVLFVVCPSGRPIERGETPWLDPVGPAFLANVTLPRYSRLRHACLQAVFVVECESKGEKQGLSADLLIFDADWSSLLPVPPSLKCDAVPYMIRCGKEFKTAGRGSVFYVNEMTGLLWMSCGSHGMQRDTKENRGQRHKERTGNLASVIYSIQDRGGRGCKNAPLGFQFPPSSNLSYHSFFLLSSFLFLFFYPLSASVAARLRPCQSVLLLSISPQSDMPRRRGEALLADTESVGGGGGDVGRCEETFPLHALVWRNSPDELTALLQRSQVRSN